MDYKEAREYIKSRTNFGIKPGLERIRRLAEMLGDPQDKIKTVHVAGTNGKGSVCTMLSSILSASGKKTGLYTSPYVADYLEQFKIDGQNITEVEYAALIEKIKRKADVLDSENDSPTEYEINTAAAFLWFCDSGCDYAVIETGLGGLMDATNIINKPELCVITSISLDHINILGKTIEEIAEQKAGIIKPYCPVVISSGQSQGVKNIISSHVSEASAHFCKKADSITMSLSGTDFTYENDSYHIPLIGTHQAENAVTALTAAKVLFPSLSCADINKGFAHTVHPARFEHFDFEIPVILDGAHNKGGADVLKETLEHIFPRQKIIGIMGMLADKEYTECISLLAPLFEKIYAVTPDSPRALSAAELSGVVSRHTNCETCDSFEEAFKKALSSNLPITVFGSLYLARIARPFITRCAEKKMLIDNLPRLHTTEMGEKRIQRNLDINCDPVDHCKALISRPDCTVYRKGKNFYCQTDHTRITVNAYSYTIITAHLVK